MRTRITAERLRELLRYEPATGQFYNLKKRGRALAGMRTSYVDRDRNRVVVHVDGHPYSAHRLVWLYMTGHWPPSGLTIDHKDSDGLNNRWANLRLATPQQQQQNRGKHRRNTSGFKGVSWSKRHRSWVAGIGHNYKSYNLGRYSTPEEAHQAYVQAAQRLHGEFARAA